jgi:hypothetical protein
LRIIAYACIAPSTRVRKYLVRIVVRMVVRVESKQGIVYLAAASASAVCALRNSNNLAC